ncbi:MAG TPA: metal ABC transporter permease [Dehalococcoidia bacterium]
MPAIADWLVEPLEFAFMQRALAAVLVVSVVSAVIGTFVVLKGMAFIGDALAHASFAGVAVAFVSGTSIYAGAVAAGVATSLAIGFVSRRTRVSFDTAIGILFVGAFSLGILILSREQGYTVDLFAFVFGDVLSVTPADVRLMLLLGAAVLLLVLAFYRELVFTAYDPTMAAATGVPVALAEYGLLALVAVTTVIAIKAVGIVLVVAMLVTPAATARLLVRRVPAMMAVGALVGGASAVAGLYLSYYAAVASGASIVLMATLAFLLALLLSPRSGLPALLRRRLPAETPGAEAPVPGSIPEAREPRRG